MHLMFLSRIAEKFSRPGRLTRSAAAARLQQLGHVIEYQRVHDIEFFFRPSAGGLFCVVLRQTPIELTQLPMQVQQAAEKSATLVMICAHPCSAGLQAEALQRGLVLLDWPHLDLFESRLKQMREFRHSALADAKRDPAAALPPSQSSLLIPLTSEQAEKSYLCRTEEISCFFVDRGGETLLIHFAPWGSDPHCPARIGSAYGESSGMSVLGFETAAPNWYPHHHMLACLASAMPLIEGRFANRIMAGASQGAYAALKYSGLLGAAATLAISPAYSIDPALTADRRFAARYKPELHSGMHIAASDIGGVASILYDPTDATDALQAESLRKELPGLNLMPLWFAGHGAPRLTRDRRSMTALMEHAAKGEPVAVHMEAVATRHHDPARPFRMALWLADRRPATALRIFNYFSPLTPTYEWWKVCYRLSQAGFAEQVVAWLAAAEPTHAELHACTAIAAEKAGQLDLAYDSIALALQHSPYSQKFLHIQRRVIDRRAAA